MKATALLILILSLLNDCYSQDALVNSGNVRMHTNAKLGVFGDFTNNGTFINNLGEVHLAGSSLQNVNGSSVIQTNDLYLNNSSNVKLDNELQVSNSMVFTNGVLQTDRSDMASEYLHFLAGSNYSNASSARYVDGVVRKTGNTRFEFPVGENGLYRYIGISPPSNVTDHFTTYYKNTDPNADGYNHGAKDATIDHISNCEYWILDRTNGSSNVGVTLSYDNLGTAGCSGVVNQADLLVARWNGSTWKDHGNSATTGAPSAGSVTTLGNVTSFSPFTLASVTAVNPLPVELLEFDAVKSGKNVRVHWSTASEINSDYFVVQKTKDLQEWADVLEVAAQGNSNTTTYYEEFDLEPYQGVSYYRLKQVDYNGEYTYSNIAAVSFEGNEANEIAIYPNPSDGVVNILYNTKSAENAQVSITNSIGQVVEDYTVVSSADGNIKLELTSLSRGVYYISVLEEAKHIGTYRVVKK